MGPNPETHGGVAKFFGGGRFGGRRESGRRSDGLSRDKEGGSKCGVDTMRSLGATHGGRIYLSHDRWHRLAWTGTGGLTLGAAGNRARGVHNLSSYP